MKFIIQNKTALTDLQCIFRLAAVVAKGRISETKKGFQYCHATQFDDCMVFVTANASGSETFTIAPRQ
jgi:hypothetical protein